MKSFYIEYSWVPASAIVRIIPKEDEWVICLADGSKLTLSTGYFSEKEKIVIEEIEHYFGILG